MATPKPRLSCVLITFSYLPLRLHKSHGVPSVVGTLPWVVKERWRMAEKPPPHRRQWWFSQASELLWGQGWSQHRHPHSHCRLRVSVWLIMWCLPRGVTYSVQVVHCMEVSRKLQSECQICPNAIFRNEFSLEYSHVRSSLYCLWLLLYYNGGAQ